jgi:L-threonylcarbamoyladenylate synthase
MQVSPTTGAHVEKSLGDAVDLILDAGSTPVGIESTVLDLSTDVPTLLRPGTITLPEIEAVIGPVAMASSAGETEARRSPGMLDKHYAPRARVVLVGADDLGVRLEHERASAQRAGAIVIHADVERTQSVIAMPSDPLGYASRLYDALHTLDDMGSDVILIEREPSAIEWLGVRARLERASR